MSPRPARVPRTPLTLSTPQAQFGCRVSGLAVQPGHVLLHRSELDDFWSLPGGRVEMLETSAEALEREMQEEMGFRVQVKRLLWVVESFFAYQKLHHELGLCFLMDLGPDFPHYDVNATFNGVEEGLELFFRWFPVEEVPTLPIYPTFLRRVLLDLPAHPEHVVHVDELEDAE